MPYPHSGSWWSQVCLEPKAPGFLALGAICGDRKLGSDLRPQIPQYPGGSHKELTAGPAYHCPRQPQARVQILGISVPGTPYLAPLDSLNLPLLLLMLASEPILPPALPTQDHDNVAISSCALLPWTRAPKVSLSSCACLKPHHQHFSKDPRWVWRCQSHSRVPPGSQLGLPFSAR